MGEAFTAQRKKKRIMPVHPGKHPHAHIYTLTPREVQSTHQWEPMRGRGWRGKKIEEERKWT